MATIPDFQSEPRLSQPMLPVPYRIHRVRKETSDTFTCELRQAGEGRGLSFAPGQFNMLYVFGVGEIPISISGNPGRAETLVHTTRAVGAVTKAMSRLRRGDCLGVRGPFGSRWPVEAARSNDVVLVAGGIGLAPLRPALYQILGQRERYGKVVLLYGARTPEDLLYRQELARWRAQFDLEIYVTVDRATSRWQGNVGVVTRMVSRAPFDPLNAVALICGPEVMMRFTVLELQKRGVSDEQIFVSLERNMKCAVGFCGHCQFGSEFVCKDGPVFRYSRVKRWLGMWEV
jgi:NAD(P)H-flavin reductase